MLRPFSRLLLIVDCLTGFFFHLTVVVVVLTGDDAVAVAG